MKTVKPSITNSTSSKPEGLKAIHQGILEAADRPLEKAIALPAAAYTNAEFYDWEVEHIFKQQWICVGHISQIPKVGDYFNLDIFGERLIIARDKENQVQVLSRVCMHRGMDLMPSAFGHPQQGNRGSFLCPYHHWSYGLDGSLLGAPHMQKNVGFEPHRCSLPTFRSELWEGFIFITFDPELESVQTQYSSLLPFVEHRQMAKMEMVVNVKWDCQFNWKVLVENFMEPYHHMGAHHKTFEPLMPAAGTWSESETAHTIACHLPLAKNILENDADYKKLIEFALSPELKPEDYREYAVYLGEPNFLLFIGPDRVYWYLLQPDGPDHMTLSTTLLVLPDSKQAENYEQRLQDATESLKQFHLEDMEVCTAVQSGLNSSAYRSGPLSHLEMPIWLFQKYLAQRIRAVSFS